MVQSIKYSRATDDVVRDQILKDHYRRNRENGLHYFGRPLPGYDDEDEYDEEGEYDDEIEYDELEDEDEPEFEEEDENDKIHGSEDDVLDEADDAS